MHILELPTQIWIPGESEENSNYNLRLCADRDGARILSVWTSEQGAVQYFRASGQDVPVVEAARNPLVLQGSHHRVFEYIYVNPNPEETFSDKIVHQLDQQRLLDVRSFEEVLWPVAKAELLSRGAENNLLIVVEGFWKKNPHLSLEEALNAAMKHPNLFSVVPEMRCAQCRYQWQSRRKSPPSKCPKCGSRNIGWLDVG